MNTDSPKNDEGYDQDNPSNYQPAQSDEIQENDDLSELIPEEKNDSGLLKKCILVIGGLGLIVLGIIGWILPVLIGVPFVIGGLAMLSVAFKPLRKWVNAWDAKLPRKWRLLIRFRKIDDNLASGGNGVEKYFPDEQK